MSDSVGLEALASEMIEATKLFFQSWNTPLPESGAVSVLYLLRRDIVLCMGRNPTTRRRTKFQAPLLGVMGVLAGVDLMGKFYAGSDQQGGVRGRFTAYLRRYFALDDTEDAEVIYQLRNALLHSFGLFSRAHGRTYHFQLLARDNPLVEQYEPNHYSINHRLLAERWERSIARYRVDQLTDTELAKNFFRMIGEYGFTHIGPGAPSS